MSKGNWVSRLGLRHTDLTRYCKVVLGYCSVAGRKQEQVVCDALDRKGLHKPAGSGSRWWIAQNAVHIAAIARSKQGVESVSRQVPVEAQKDFLESYQWRALRMAVLKKYGPKCMCCGATPQHGAVMNVDHIKPRRLFPHLALDMDNLQVLCHECNHGKGNWDQTDWRDSGKEEIDPDVLRMLKSIAAE